MVILAYVLANKQRIKRKVKTSKSPPLLIPATVTTTDWPITINIGILAPLANEAAHNLHAGLSALLSISSRTKYTITPFWADNTRVTLFNYAQQAAQECDLLITWGVTCANIASEADAQLQNIPIIKAGLRSEQLYKLLPNNSQSVTVITEYDYAQQVALFKKIKPTAHYICIMYRHHNDNMRHEVQALYQELIANGFKTDIQLLAHLAHIDYQLSAFNKPYDTLFIMPHTLTAANVQELITYCNNKKITLCAQEIDIVTLGAAIGFGEHEKALGGELGHLIRNMFEGKQKYNTETTITHYPHYRCVINKNKCHLQGIAMTNEYLTMLEQIHLFNTVSPTHSLPDVPYVSINKNV